MRRIDRREFLHTTAGLLALGTSRTAARGESSARASKAPFKVLYSNDTTNIITCVSPYHKKGQGLTTEMIQATVDEAAGVDVHMLQPGLGWIPWWKSRVYPAEEHYRWFTERTGHKPDAFGRYMLDGGDIVKVFIDRCRKKGQVPFVSLRMNDGHHLENVDTKERASISCSKFYVEHPEYRIGANKRDWNQHVLNWAIPEVREHKFSFIKEICENYDIDGFEMDFMRHTSYFQLDKTPVEQRREIIAEFTRRVRELLDRTSRPGKRRWLCARVPCLRAMHDVLGVDLPMMVEAGLDMANLSAYYFTMQQTDLAEIRKRIPGAAVYLEMTHCTTTGPSRGGYDSFVFRRTTDEQFYTAANLAYHRGADGMSLFNFVYYREHGTPGRGPFNEPPFRVLKRLGQPDWLATQPQWYVLAKVWHDKRMGMPAPIPKTFKKRQTHAWKLDMAPTDAQRQDGLMRLMTQEDSSGRGWKVVLNGAELKPTAFTAKPLDHPYEGGLGQPNQYACFVCPRAIVKNGPNQLAITMTEGKPATVTYIDLILNAGG
ncbi:MAG: alpha-galactosidase [Phycisphaerae bacterium]|nr:alpha-galactosidase [Phycisphaerae bacterium]